MFDFPQYDSDGSETIGFSNAWLDHSPQPLLGTDCFSPFAQVNNSQNRFLWEGTGLEFRQIFSALLLGAEFAYPQSYLQVVANFLRMVHCPIDFEEECQVFPPYAGVAQYSPMSPFINPDFIPEGYLAPPFVLVTDENIGEYPQNEIGDISVGIGALTLDVNWFEDIAGQLPTLTIRVQGEGTVNLEFLNQTSGGLIVVTVDNPPNLADIIIGIVTGSENILDTNMDILSLPPETAITQIYPVPVTGAGIHTIYAVWLPILDDSLIPVRFGGGFRKFELCDFEEFPDMGITDLRFDPTFRLQKLVLGEWSDISGAETFDLEIQAIALNALKGYIGAQQILTISDDPTYPEVTWAGSNHQAQHENISLEAAIGRAIAESLRDVTDLDFPDPNSGFVGSALQAYIDAGDVPFDPSELEADIAAAAAAAATAQASADSANMAIAAVEEDIDSLDSRISVLEGERLWSVHFDFLASNDGWGSSSGDWNLGVGWDWFGNNSLSLADSTILDGRVMYVRLEIENVGSVSQSYLFKIDSGNTASLGRGVVGDHIHYHKVSSQDTLHDVGLEFTSTGSWILKAATFYGVGTQNPPFAP